MMKSITADERTAGNKNTLQNELDSWRGARTGMERNFADDDVEQELDGILVKKLSGCGS